MEQQTVEMIAQMVLQTISRMEEKSGGRSEEHTSELQSH